MRSLFAAMLLFLAMGLNAQKVTPFDTTLWHTNYDSVLTLAKQTNRPVFMVFSGSDWCKPCIILHERILVDTLFSDWAENNVILLFVDFPKQKKNALSQAQLAHNENLAEKYNMNGVFPLVLLVSSEEKVLGQLEDIDLTPAEYIQKITSIIQKPNL